MTVAPTETGFHTVGLLADPAPMDAYDALEPAYQIARLRIEAGLTQTQLAALRVTASDAGNSAVSVDPVFLRVRFAPGVSVGSNQCLGGNTEILTLYPLTIAGVANGQNIPLG
jgi:hypothetical protein